MEEIEETSAPRDKPGPKPKRLVEATYTGIEVGRGERKRVIDPNEVEKLASIGMNDTEISEFLDIDDSTLRYNFKRNLVKGRYNLKSTLRQAQLRLAVEHLNPTMLIWLGKNILQQKDQPVSDDATRILPFSDDDDAVTMDSDDLTVNMDVEPRTT